MFARIATIVIALAVAGGASAQEKKRIEKAADLPRFTYTVDGKLDAVVKDDAKFRAFAKELRRDTESVLAQYDIADKAMLRQMLGVIVRLDYLEGRYDDALKGLARIKELEDKPADKLLSGMSMRAMIGAERKVGNRDSDAYRAEVDRLIAADLANAAVRRRAERGQGSEGERGNRQRSVGARLSARSACSRRSTRPAALSSDLAPILVNARYRIVAVLPAKDALVSSYSKYLAANKVDKPDIWAARDVKLAPGKGSAPVRIAIWDSGVDTSLFGNQVVKGADGKPAVIAFDKYANPATGELQAIPADLRGKVPQMKARLKGFSDLQSNIDSPEASEVKKFLSGLKPDEYKSVIEEINLTGNWMHGTHVAGIAVAGNPYAQLVVARIEFGHTLRPDPCPSKELSERDARNMQAYVDFMKKNNVRVVNMSWGGSVKGVEDELELCGIGKTPEERKTIARAVLRDPERCADEGDGQRAGDPVRHVGRQLQRGLDVRRGDSCRHRAAEPADGRRGRQGRRRGVVHELRPDSRRARERLPGGERDPGRREACRVGHVDVLAAGREPRGQDARRESGDEAGRRDRHHPRHRRQDCRRTSRPRQSEEGRRRGGAQGSVVEEFLVGQASA